MTQLERGANKMFGSDMMREWENPDRKVDSNDCSPECAVFLGNLVNLGLIADALDVYDPSEYIDKQGYKIY